MKVEWFEIDETGDDGLSDFIKREDINIKFITQSQEKYINVAVYYTMKSNTKDGKWHAKAMSEVTI